MYTSFSVNLECYDSYISNKMLNKTNFLQLAGRYSVSPFRTNNQPVSLGYQPLHIGLLTLRRKLSITQSQRTCRKMYLCFEQTSTMRINNCYKFNCYLALKIVLTLTLRSDTGYSQLLKYIRAKKNVIMIIFRASN